MQKTLKFFEKAIFCLSMLTILSLVSCGMEDSREENNDSELRFVRDLLQITQEKPQVDETEEADASTLESQFAEELKKSNLTAKDREFLDKLNDPDASPLEKQFAEEVERRNFNVAEFSASAIVVTAFALCIAISVQYRRSCLKGVTEFEGFRDAIIRGNNIDHVLQNYKISAKGVQGAIDAGDRKILALLLDNQVKYVDSSREILMEYWRKVFKNVQSKEELFRIFDQSGQWEVFLENALHTELPKKVVKALDDTEEKGTIIEVILANLRKADLWK